MAFNPAPGSKDYEELGGEEGAERYIEEVNARIAAAQTVPLPLGGTPPGESTVSVTDALTGQTVPLLMSGIRVNAADVPEGTIYATSNSGGDWTTGQDTIRQIQEAMDRANRDGQAIFPHQPAMPDYGASPMSGPYPIWALTAQIDRLIGLQLLTEDERAFVRAALQPGQGRDFFLVLADYLEEQGRQAASERFRQMGS
jgi:hypothetical protein